MLFHLISVHSRDLIFLSEPKVSFDSPNPIGLQPLDFTSFFSNTNSTLWCLGKPSANLSFSLLDHSSQHITIITNGSFPSSSCLITSVYGTTDYRMRRSLWDYLVNISHTILPWCVVGDFKAILSAFEKYSSPPAPLSVKDFSDMVQASGLKDLGFRGNCYTWANNR